MTRIELTIRRPNGEIETLDVTDKLRAAGHSRMTDPLFRATRKATKQAGRGWALSYRNINERTDAEKALDDVLRLYDEAKQLREGTGEYDLAHSFRVEQQADDAMQTWRETYPEAAAARDERIKAEREAREAARRERYENSFVARNLD